MSSLAEVGLKRWTARPKAERKLTIISFPTMRVAVAVSGHAPLQLTFTELRNPGSRDSIWSHASPSAPGMLRPDHNPTSPKHADVASNREIQLPEPGATRRSSVTITQPSVADPDSNRVVEACGPKKRGQGGKAARRTIHALLTMQLGEAVYGSRLKTHLTLGLSNARNAIERQRMCRWARAGRHSFHHGSFNHRRMGQLGRCPFRFVDPYISKGIPDEE